MTGDSRLTAYLLGLGAIATGAVVGWTLWQGYRVWKRRAHYHQAIQSEAALFLPGSGGPAAASGKSIEERLLAYAVALDVRSASATFRWLAPARLRRRPWGGSLWETAGLEGRVSFGAFWEARVRLALAAALCALPVGLVFSTELGLLLAGVGAGGGWQALPWALGRRSRQRAEEMERHLSEMLDVMALGLRSGLPFERSLQLYLGHFDTLLAQSFAAAHRQWSCGLASRAQALRKVAASYDSPLLGRVVENIIRSLRFGSTLAENLEDAAREARNGYRARKQEQVAKAPVKMMVPTGVLILPAMLILVLGPVLLELAGGF